MHPKVKRAGNMNALELSNCSLKSEYEVAEVILKQIN
jgi:hypothetical protein